MQFLCNGGSFGSGASILLVLSTGIKFSEFFLSAFSFFSLFVLCFHRAESEYVDDLLDQNIEPSERLPVWIGLTKLSMEHVQ